MKPELKEKLENYKTPARAIELIKDSKIVFLVGIWGVGKNTVLNKLLETGDYCFIVSHTTRKPRQNDGVWEVDGQVYHFVTAEEFERLLDEKQFVEAKAYSGNIYGTSIDEIKKARDSHKIAVSELDIQGAAEYKNVSTSVVAIFLLPPDFETWQTRLLSRYGEAGPDPEDMKKRLATAKTELQEALSKDYFEFVINDDLDRAVSAVDEIVAGNISEKKNDEAKTIARNLLQKL